MMVNCSFPSYGLRKDALILAWSPIWVTWLGSLQVEARNSIAFLPKRLRWKLTSQTVRKQTAWRRNPGAIQSAIFLSKLYRQSP
jgi:hypothetical protein